MMKCEKFASLSKILLVLYDEQLQM